MRIISSSKIDSDNTIYKINQVDKAGILKNAVVNSFFSFASVSLFEDFIHIKLGFEQDIETA